MSWCPSVFLQPSNVALANFDALVYGAEYLDLRKGDVIIRLAIPKYPLHQYTSKQKEFLGCIEDPWIRRRWEKLLEARHGMQLSMTVQSMKLYVYPRRACGNYTRIDCRDVDCRSVGDAAAFRIGGNSPILQKYVIRQLPCVLVMESVLAKLEEQVPHITFTCTHGKHRSMACAKLCQLLFLPSVWIYQYRKDTWFWPLSHE